MGASASKIKFRESLAALTTRDVSASDAEFWDELWKIPSSSEEVFELLTPGAARRLRDDRFDNLATLFTQATAQLCQIVETPYTIYFDQALNCVRVLTRVVPFLLEKGDLGENDPNVELLCWGEKGGSADCGGGGTAAVGGGGAPPASDKENSGKKGNKVKRGGGGRGGGGGRWGRDGSKAKLAVVIEDENKKTRGKGRETAVRSPSITPRTTSDSYEEEGEVDVFDEDEDTDGEGSEEADETSTANEGGGNNDSGGDDDDDSEPLALLVVHAAMHMLFLPQFTCEFYEEDPTAAGGTSSSRGDDVADDGDDDSSSDERDDDEHENALDREGVAEAGLGTRPRRIGGGIRLAPRPAGIVWAPGVGFTPDGRCHVGASADPAASAPAPPSSSSSSSWEKGKGHGGRGGGGGKSKKNARDPGDRDRGDGGGGAEAAHGGGGRLKFNPEAAYTRKYDRNRIEVLRLLLASCSDPLFSPADEYNPLASRWMSVAVAADAPNAPCLFYSLLNIAISYDPGKSAGFGGHHVELVELSAQVLCVLLDCGLSGDPVPYENRRGEPVVALEEAYKVGFNIFRVLLARINSGRDLNTLYRGFVRLLRNMFESKSTLLPGSQARLECHQEILILLWKTLEENPLFLDFILTRCDVCELVVPICYLMYVSRRDNTQVGLIHICTFILLKLSGERSFGVTLNRPFRTKLPCDLPLFSGSHADLVSITLHKIIVNGSYRLVPLYSCFLTIISNFSPYWRSMSLLASVKLVNLFELFSSPKFLYSSEKAYRHIALLLEIFNNIVQYQYIGNQHLVYAIVRRKDSFGRLASLTLPRALAQCQKAFPTSERPEYDADAEDQVAAMSTRIVDDAGNPVKKDEKPHLFVDTAAEDGNDASGGSAKRGPAGRFVPTDAWIAELRSNLPMETMNRLLQHLVPVVDDMCQRKNGVVDEVEILEVFKDITMVGLLPVPHAIVIRKYQPNQYTSIWFTAFMWGVIFLRSQKPPIFDGERIELFQVSNEGETGSK